MRLQAAQSSVGDPGLGALEAYRYRQLTANRRLQLNSALDRPITPAMAHIAAGYDAFSLSFPSWNAAAQIVDLGSYFLKTSSPRDVASPCCNHEAAPLCQGPSGLAANHSPP